MNVANYHGIFTYHFGEDYQTARPYLFGGLGATRYKSFEVDGRSVEGETRFSTTWGAGIKAYPGDSVGINLRVRWTPTYIKSDPGGWWCDPWWGCFQTANAQYSNQFEFTGGLSFRF
jgi:opacity protein-like surface antigen